VDFLHELARTVGPTGEAALRVRRVGRNAVEELIVNGAFAMDSFDTVTERELAQLAIAAGAGRVLVGGLGLGYTTAELLRLGAVSVDVVELEPALVGWAHRGLTATLAAVSADPRVRLHVGDIATVLLGKAEPSGTWDAILLDVDNGPDFLIHESNAGLYTPRLLRAAYERLRPGGLLAIWCQSRVPELNRLCRSLPGTATERTFGVRRGDRDLEYVIYTVTSPAARPVDGSARMTP